MTPRPATWLLARALREPTCMLDASARDWTLLLRQGRSAGLLGRAAERVAGALAAAGRQPPAQVQAHLEAAQRVQRAQQAEILRETMHLRRALADLGAPVVVLKGAAYLLAEWPAAQGRQFSDVDILVPKASLARAESLLMQHGWLGTHHNAYDQRYYREWMHELPPMEHVHRRTVLDVHHTLLPETARLRPDAQALFADAQPLSAHPGLAVLSLPDAILHSMTHLFMNEEQSHALRDLSDIDALLRHAAGTPGFWDALRERAQRHQLGRMLHHGLRYSAMVFGTPVPAGLCAGLLGAQPPIAVQQLLDMLWLRAFDPTRAPPAAAELALYVRGHWLRMPPLLLARHLAVKALGLHATRDDNQAGAAPR